MTKFKSNFNIKKIEKIIQKCFPNAKIKKYEKFSFGLVSPTFKVEIKNPSKILVVKLGKVKNKEKFEKNNKILNYINKKGIPAPKIFFGEVVDRKFVTIMDFALGNVAHKAYENGKMGLRKNILEDVGKKLKLIHNLKIPSFWVHQEHEIKSKKEWKKWTKLRIDKYLKFFKRKLGDYFPFLEKELKDFKEILKKEKIDFFDLHWDYHLSNIKKHFTDKELKLIRGYFLLHLLAVSRTIWFRQKRLKWLIDEHKNMIEELRGK